MLLLESWQDTVAAELKLYVSNKVLVMNSVTFFFIRLPVYPNCIRECSITQQKMYLDATRIFICKKFSLY